MSSRRRDESEELIVEETEELVEDNSAACEADAGRVMSPELAVEFVVALDESEKNHR